MKHTVTDIFGMFTALCLAVANELQTFWVIWLGVEQCQTGFGYGTNISTLGILPMLVTAAAIPAAAAGIVYLTISLWRRSSAMIPVINLALLGKLILQVGLIWLFLCC